MAVNHLVRGSSPCWGAKKNMAQSFQKVGPFLMDKKEKAWKSINISQASSWKDNKLIYILNWYTIFRIIFDLIVEVKKGRSVDKPLHCRKMKPCSFIATWRNRAFCFNFSILDDTNLWTEELKYPWRWINKGQRQTWPSHSKPIRKPWWKDFKEK